MISSALKRKDTMEAAAAAAADITTRSSRVTTVRVVMGASKEVCSINSNPRVTTPVADIRPKVAAGAGEGFALGC